MDLSVVPYSKQSNHNHNHHKTDNESEDGDVVEPKIPTANNKNSNRKSSYNDTISTNNNNDVVRYRECMRNHAATIGGHANDGCGEFMPINSSPLLDLTCAACGCHRNFHRREIAAGNYLHPHHHHHPPLLLYTAANAAAAAPATPRWDHHKVMAQREASYERRSSETPEREDVATGNAGAVGSGGSSGKRFRTKFTQEQRDRMLAFAESIGWRIQRHDDMAINQFCSDIGVKRNVLKVWMHNNKNAHRRRETDLTPPPMAAAPNPPQAVGV